MSKVLSKDLEAALENLMEVQPDLSALSMVVGAVRAAYRALPATPTGPWIAYRDTGGWWVERGAPHVVFRVPNERTAEAYRDALNVAEQRLTEGA